MKRILICDDMPELREWLVAVAAELGYPCTAAQTGREAVEACSKHAYRLVFLDDRLDDMTGKDACLEIRQLPRPNCDPFIVLFTGFPSQADAEVTLGNDGINLHLVKPQPTREIERLMRTVMEAK